MRGAGKLTGGSVEPLYFALFFCPGELAVDDNHDKVFFVTFGAVVGVLVSITAVCITAARIVTPAPEPDAAAAQRLDERTRPVGMAITDAKLLKVSMAAPAAHAAQPPDQVFSKVCSACHGAGLLGAPKVGDKAAWSARVSAAGGLNGLTASAIKGKNAMPPRGGAADLGDDELKATIQYMMKQSGV